MVQQFAWSDSAQNQVQRCLSFKPWPVIAKEEMIRRKRLECILKEINDDPLYQYKQIEKNNESKTKFLKEIFDRDKDLSFSFLGKSSDVIRDRMNLTDEDRYDIVNEQVALLNEDFRKKLYESLWKKCLGKGDESKYLDTEQQGENSTLTPDDRAKLMSERKRRLSAGFDEKHGMMPWEGPELPKLRKLHEEIDEEYSGLHLEFLEPLLKGGIGDDEEADHHNRRAVMYHITKSVKPGEGGVWETAFLQNVELRSRLESAIQRISFLENERENVYRVVDEKIEKEAVARDLLIHKTKQNQERAQSEATSAKLKASKLEVRVELLNQLKAKQNEFKKLSTEHHDIAQKLVMAEKNVANLKKEVLAMKYQVKQQPALWQLKQVHKKVENSHALHYHKHKHKHKR